MTANSLTPDSTPDSCAFCEKKGLPILPVRYALATDSSHAPKVAAPFKVEDLAAGGSLGLAGGNVCYTTRSLRYGYLYTYDEARDYWRAYLVAHGGYFMEFDINRPLPPAYRSCRPCSRDSHPQKASFVTVSSPEDATRVWFAYSDVEWTAAVLAKHQSARWRQKHMRALDVEAWLASRTGSEAAPIAQVAETVAEYSPDTRADRFTFSSAMHYRHDAQSTIEVANAIYPDKGVVVALHDAAGVAMDLAALMETRLRRYVTHKDFERPLTSSAAIMQLKAAVESQSDHAIIDQHIRQATQVARIGEPGMGGGGANAGVALMRSFNSDLDADYRRLEGSLPSKSHLLQQRTKAWEKYAEKYNESARSAWQGVYNERLRQFDQENIAPLATAHVAWMRSQRLRRSMECNYDENDGDSGAVYQRVITLVIGSTQDKKACNELYTEWLKGTPEDTGNLLLRAMLLNHAPLTKNAVEAATASSLGLDGLPWDQLFTLYDQAAGSAGSNGVAQLITGMAGPAANLLGKVIDGTVAASVGGVVALGIATRTPYHWVKASGTSEELVRGVLEALQANGGAATRGSVKRELRRLKILGAPLEQRVQMRMIGIRQGSASGASIVRLDRYLADEVQVWRSAINGESRASLGAGLVQLAVLTVAFDKMLNAMEHEDVEVKTRFAAMSAGVAGTFSDNAGKVLGRVTAQGLRYGHGVMEVGGRMLTKWGARASIVSGVVLALADFWAADEAWGERDYAAAWLYGLSGTAGLVLIIAIAAAWGFVPIAILIALSFAIAAAIAKFVDDNIENWLERCHWGKPNPAIRQYPDLDTEIRQLRLATQG